MTNLSLSNIQNAQRFFDVVNDCVRPIHVCLPNGKIQDLRFNLIMQNFLLWMKPFGNIAVVDLKCNSLRDLENLICFIEEDHCDVNLNS